MAEDYYKGLKDPDLARIRNAPAGPKRKQALYEEFGPIVDAVHKKTGYSPQKIMLGMISEGGWDLHNLENRGYNVTNIKLHNADMPYVEYAGDKFRDYGKGRKPAQAIGAALEDHVNFLRTNPRYREALETDNVIDYAKAMGVSGYSADAHYPKAILGAANSLLDWDWDQYGGSRPKVQNPDVADIKQRAMQNNNFNKGTPSNDTAFINNSPFLQETSNSSSFYGLPNKTNNTFLQDVPSKSNNTFLQNAPSKSNNPFLQPRSNLFMPELPEMNMQPNMAMNVPITGQMPLTAKDIERSMLGWAG